MIYIVVILKLQGHSYRLNTFSIRPLPFTHKCTCEVSLKSYCQFFFVIVEQSLTTKWLEEYNNNNNDDNNNNNNNNNN